MNSNKFKISVLSALALLGTTGCNDFLNEVKPETSQEVSSLRTSSTDLDVLINGAYGALAASAGPIGQSVMVETFLSDLFKANPDPSKRNGWVNSREDDAYSTRYSTSDYSAQAYIMQWGNLAMNMGNTVVESLDKGMADKDAKLYLHRDRLKGEGLLIRSITNFEMTRLLGKQYHASTLSAPAAVYREIPIISPSDIPSPRRTVGEMYTFLVRDLTDAQKLLPETYNNGLHPVAFKIRPKKDVATGLLARVYFQMNELDKALEQVDLLLGPVSENGSAKYPLASNYDEVFRLLGNNDYGPNQGREVIYAFEGMTAQRGTDASKWAIYQWTNPTGNRTNARLMIGRPYRELMSTDSLLDKRYSAFVNKVGTNWWLKKYAMPGVNQMYMRAAEFHLMRAEILARKSRLPEALTELNLIRKRAGLLPFVSVDQNAILAEVIRQRGVEMIGENNRFWDLKRLGALTNGTVKVTLGERTAAERAYTGGADRVEWNSDLLQFPMPTNEAMYNPGL